MKLLFATHNQGKLKELRELVGDALEVVSPSELGLSLEVDEDQDSFEGNARKKALAFLEATGLPSLADDSGLCVDALEGAPGVHSARYGQTDADRIERLLAALAEVGPQRRQASFRCALCLALPSGAILTEVGACHGLIATAPRGTHGFGYDPVFLIEEQGKTLAELTSGQKSALSHRGVAFRKMAPHLRALGTR